MTRPRRTSKCRPAAALAILLSLVGTATTRADTLVLDPVRDNTLYEDAGGSLSNGAGEYLFVGKTGTNKIRRCLLAFDVSASVPLDSKVVSVELALHMSRSITGSRAVELRRVLADWGEGASNAEANEGGGAPAETDDATWLHAFYPTEFWTSIGGDFAGSPSATTSVGGVGDYLWGSTPGMVADVQSWLDDPSGDFGWLLLGDETTAVTAKRFDSRENSDPGVRPTLTVEFVPKAIFTDDFESGDTSAWASTAH